MSDYSMFCFQDQKLMSPPLRGLNSTGCRYGSFDFLNDYDSPLQCNPAIVPPFPIQDQAHL
ncbi:hypothetical protein E4U21_000480 [Claviceps maximensis]|nr:hypothetical protein E4U21_000480 [Claviceps maximensis]